MDERTGGRTAASATAAEMLAIPGFREALRYGQPCAREPHDAAAANAQAAARVAALARCLMEDAPPAAVAADGGRAAERRADFSWDHAFDVGIPGIDAEHEALAGLVGELFESASVLDGAVRARAAAARLAAAAAEHFAHEERLMDEHGYPGAGRHKAVHAALLATLGRIAERLGSGHAWHAGTMALFAEDFLFHHVDREDRPLARFLLKRR